MKNKKFFLLFILFLFSLWQSSKATSSYLCTIPASEVELVRKFETSHSYIGVVRHKKTNALYIVKQKKNRNSTPWSAIQAILAYEYANSTGQIISQRVYIVPKEINFPGKMYPNELASLHTIVPGMSVKNWQYSVRGINLKKVAELVTDFSIKLPRDGGIDINIIASMTRHNDLPPILALHLLVGFYDCHNKNIFYDYHMNRFSIIDMDSCYKSPLASFSYQTLKNILMRKDVIKKLTLSPTVQNALLNFADMIELMIEKNPIKKINAILIELFNLLKLNNSPDRKKFLRRIMKTNPFLRASYADAQKIVKLIRSACKLPRKHTEKIVINPPRYSIVSTYNTILNRFLAPHIR